MLSEGIRKQIRPRLEQAFGARLRDVILYGSEARGEARDDSDVDLLVLLEEPVRLALDLGTAVEALYPLQLQSDRPLHAMPVGFAEYQRDDCPLYLRVRQEGVAL